MAEGKEAEFNKELVGRSSPSKHTIEGPGNWGVSKLYGTFKGNTDFRDFRKACCFKSAFNIKPDIVIEIGKGRAICIEAKYCSKEGQYPSGAKYEKGLFRKHGKEYVRQTEVQHFMMKEILGMDFQGVFITSDGNSQPWDSKPFPSSWTMKSWEGIFKKMDFRHMSQGQKRMYKWIIQPKAGR